MLLTLEDWLAHIERQHGQSIALGLDRVRAVKASLGQSQSCPVILVAGTNGKGSTCAMLERILVCAGYRVGLYTSPHLLRYNERVRIDARPVSDALLCDAFARVEEARGNMPLTYFEFGTLAAWEVFAAANLDAVILEVGLGGRLDAVNIYEPDCAVITTIDLDHMEYLGDTRDAIGVEKAGIFRAGRPAVCGDPEPPHSLLEQAATLDVDLQLIGRDFGYRRLDQQWQYWGREGNRSGLAHPALRGANQLSNASVALACLDALNGVLPVAMQDVRRGLVEVELTGRFHVLAGRPTIVLDVAHNPQAARVLAGNLGDMAFHPETWGVFGMLRDKDIPAVIAPMLKRITRWLPCTLDGSRAATGEELRGALRAAGVVGSLPNFPSPGAAASYAIEHAGENDRIVAFGSFLTVADALRTLKRDVL